MPWQKGFEESKEEEKMNLHDDWDRKFDRSFDNFEKNFDRASKFAFVGTALYLLFWLVVLVAAVVIGLHFLGKVW
jgi:hypothetical protein